MESSEYNFFEDLGNKMNISDSHDLIFRFLELAIKNINVIPNTIQEKKLGEIVFYEVKAENCNIVILSADSGYRVNFNADDRFVSTFIDKKSFGIIFYGVYKNNSNTYIIKRESDKRLIKKGLEFNKILEAAKKQKPKYDFKQQYELASRIYMKEKNDVYTYCPCVLIEEYSNNELKEKNIEIKIPSDKGQNSKIIRENKIFCKTYDKFFDKRNEIIEFVNSFFCNPEKSISDIKKISLGENN